MCAHETSGSIDLWTAICTQNFAVKRLANLNFEGDIGRETQGNPRQTFDKTASHNAP